MDGFSADLRGLTEAATIVGELGRELYNGSSLRYWMQPSEAGDLPLADALADLQDATSRAAELLENNSQAVSHRLAQTEAAYRSVDEAGAETLNGIRGAARHVRGRRD